MNVRKLVEWIDAHDPRPEPTVINPDGTLTVSSLLLGKEGDAAIERERIPATLSAARALLGY